MPDTLIYGVRPQPGRPLSGPDPLKNREEPQAKEPSKCLNRQSYVLGSSLCRIQGVPSGRTASAREREREKTRETSLDRAKSARERERKRQRERERENDQTGEFAGSGRVWQSRAILYFLP